MVTRTAYAGTASDGDIYTAANHDRMPGGWIGRDSNSADFASITAASGKQILIPVITVTTQAGRLLRASAHVPHLEEVGSTANGRVIIRIEDSLGTEWTRANIKTDDVDGDDSHSVQPWVVLDPGASTETFALSMTVVTGTWSSIGSNSAHELLIEDLGPA